MQLTFLKAAVPLSKTISYSERDDTFTTSHYPMIKRVSSEEATVENMLQFSNAIERHGAKGHCLLLGGLDRPLLDESRAEHTIKNWPHQWICFDFDKVDAPPNMDGALQAIAEYLPPECQPPECVIQLSPSCFNPRAKRLSCHVFMKLDKPADSETLKDFFVWVNHTGKLAPYISLTDSGNTLSYRLDRCVTDPSRLIYIAPPRMIGFKRNDNFEWLGHFEGEPALKLPRFTPISREQRNELIAKLRFDAGLPEREFKTVKYRGMDVLQTEPGIISDVRASGNHYLRFNLNGGDSLAYFVNLKDPEVIHNFKGELPVLTKEVDENFYKALIKTTQKMPVNATSPENTDVLAFYATNRGSQLYIGTYDRGTDKLRVDKSSPTAAVSWLLQFGMPGGTILPHYDLTFDISSNIRYEEGYPVINLYERTNFMKQFGESSRIRSLDQTMVELKTLCPVIMKFVESITGDPRSCQGFINWLAFIFQYRIKTGTAWLLWGTEGSGKGKFLEHVCRPLFGQNSVGQVMMSNIDKQFNSLLEGKVLVNIDEAAMSRSRDRIEAMAKLRNYITESTIVINEKNVTEREVPSFCNFIISSNDFRPLVISASDRRMHVGSRQEVRLVPTANEFAILTQGEELPHFARLLGELIVDEFWVRNPELTEQKMRLFESAHSLTDTVAMAIQQGDASFFFEARMTQVQLATAANQTLLLPLKQYDALLYAMLDGTLNILTQEDLYVLFSVVVNDNKHFPDNATAQKNLYNRYGLLSNKSKHCLRTGRTRYGTEVGPWQEVPEALIDQSQLPPKLDPAETVINIKAKR